MGAETSDWYNKYCLIGFAKQRGKAWHYRQSAQGKEPNHYDGSIPVDDILRRLLYWQATSGTVFTEYENADGDMVTIEDPTRQTIIRNDTGTIYGIFKQSYQIHQHSEWLIDQATAILDTNKHDVGIANAVLLKGGAVCSIQYELPESVVIPGTGGIEIRPSMLSVGSLDGSLSTTYLKTVVNVVCDNTMNSALSNYLANRLKIRHSKYSHLRLDEARNALEIIFEIADEFTAEVKSLLDVKVTGKDFRKYLNLVAPTEPDNDGKNPLTGKAWSNKAETMAEQKQQQLLTLWMDDARVTPWAGTAYGIWQMNNTYNHHIVGTNGDTVRGERNMFDAARNEFGKSDSAALDLLFTKVLVDA